MGAKPEKGALPEQLDEAAFLAFERKADRQLKDLPRFFPKKPKSDAPSARLDDKAPASRS